MPDLLDQARQLLPEAVQLRRSIHAEPEVGLDLPLTQAKVLAALQDLPLSVRTGQRTTSVVADLRGAHDGPVVLLRADMDALPLHEDTGLEFASRRPGAMHACGHDAHTAMLASAARLLASRQADLHGTVRFMFQPGEEGFGGAKVMLDEGLLDGTRAPAAAFALHATPRWPAGTIATRSGPVLASADAFSISVRGRGGHASAPHLAADPVPVACEIVLALQTFVTRSVSIFAPGVLTVAHLEAGTTHNIIPEMATLRGTVRALAPETREQILAGIQRVARGVGEAHGLSAEVAFEPGYPVTVNDQAAARLGLEVASRLLGAERAVEQPTPQMAAEDFSFILEQVPGAMLSLGTRPHGLAEHEAPAGHSNRYLLEEDAMANGIAFYAAVALEFLDQAR
jgi:hippurate hydrolase